MLACFATIGRLTIGLSAHSVTVSSRLGYYSFLLLSSVKRNTVAMRIHFYNDYGWLTDYIRYAKK
ncbi:hypothetical protein BLOT_003271 [Blomia tropicalis]|nr:hypothetical protein BLOT_003271 [Blomia tropicalis]